MAKVPVETPQESLNVPGVERTYGNFGAAGEATERLGGDIAQGTMSIADQLNHLQAVNTSAAALFQTQQFSDQLQQKLKTQSPDGFMHTDQNDPSSPILLDDSGKQRGILDEYHDQMNEHYQQTQASLPTGMAAQMYRDRALPQLSQQTAELRTEAHKMIVQDNATKDAQDLEARGFVLGNNPDIGDLYNNIADIRKTYMAKMGVLGETGAQTNAKILEATNKLTLDTFQGVYTSALDAKKTQSTQARTDLVNKWIEVADGLDPLSKQREALGLPTLKSGMIDANKLQIEKEKLIRTLPVAGALDHAGLEAMTKATWTNLASGPNKADPTQVQSVLQGWTQYAKSNPDKAPIAAENIAMTFAKESVGSILTPAFRGSALSSRLQASAYLEERAVNGLSNWAKNNGVTVSPDMAAMAKKTIHDEINGLNKSIETEKDADYGKYLQGDPADPSKDVLSSGKKFGALDFSRDKTFADPVSRETIRQYFSDAHALDKVNPPHNYLNFRLTNKEESSELANPLSPRNASDGSGLSNDMAFKRIQNMSSAMRGDFPRVMSEMMGDGNLSNAWRIAGLHANDGDKVAGSAVIAAIRGGPEIDANFQTALKARGSGILGFGVTEKTMTDAVSAAFQPYLQAQTQGNPNNTDKAKINAEIIAAGTNYAKMQWTQNQGMTEENAAKTAYQQMIGNHFNSVTTGNGGSGVGGFFRPSRIGETEVPVSWNGRMLGDVDKETIRQNLHAMMSEGGLPKLGATIPTVNGVANQEAGNFLPMVAKTAVASLNDSKTGYNIWYDNGGTDKKGFSQQRVLTTRDSHGREVPVTIPVEKTLVPFHPRAFDTIRTGVQDTIRGMFK